MSKITFRADDELIQRLEAFDASKSEVMREALRSYLDEHASDPPATDAGADASIDDLIVDRVDEVIADRLDRSFTPRQPQDVNVNITLDGDGTVNRAGDDEESTAAAATETADASRDENHRKTPGEADETGDAAGRETCAKCGETVTPDHVYCPNCGEKASQRVFCECGDELRSDWAFCPGCGRRTPAADVLDQA